MPARPTPEPARAAATATSDTSPFPTAAREQIAPPSVRAATLASLAPPAAPGSPLSPDPVAPPVRLERLTGERPPAPDGAVPSARLTSSQPAATPVGSPAILPALQAFGAAMRQALADERKPAQASDAAIVAPPPLTAAAVTIQPVAADAPALDTADRRWPHAMAAQIDRLRDAADETSTRIRLLPDALGPVDVAVRRDGDAVHVHLTAHQAETRQLLIDAQPRLADAADARGLKLGRTEVAGGDLPGERHQQRPTPQPRTPSRPAPTRARVAAADATDTRIA